MCVAGIVPVLCRNHWFQTACRGGGNGLKTDCGGPVCVVSLSLRSAPLHVLRGGGAESENYCPGFAENSRERKRQGCFLTKIFLLFDENMFTLPFDENSLEPCFLTKILNDIYIYILQFLSNIARYILNFPSNHLCECTVKVIFPR